MKRRAFAALAALSENRAAFEDWRPARVSALTSNEAHFSQICKLPHCSPSIYIFAGILSIMKRISVILIALIGAAGILRAQNLDCNEELTCRVTAPSGMSLRNKPSLDSKVVGRVPHDSLVVACGRVYGSMTYEDIKGNWRRVEYNGQTGYMFDGFLKIESIDRKVSAPKTEAAQKQTAHSKKPEQASAEAKKEEPKPQKAKEAEAAAEQKTTAKEPGSAEKQELNRLDCAEELTCRVSASSGMNMRNEPNLESKVVGHVPYDSVLIACGKVYGSMTYEDLNGYWRRVQYDGQIGYIFDGFLKIESIDRKAATPESQRPQTKRPQNQEPKEASAEAKTEDAKPEKPMDTKDLKEDSEPTTKEVSASAEKPDLQILTEVFNYCGNVKEINTTMLWYGFYPSGDESTTYRIEPVELEIALSKFQEGDDMQFDIKTDKEQSAIFLLGSNSAIPTEKLNIPDQTERLVGDQRKIFPGQAFQLDEKSSLSATGSIRSAGECPDIENYELRYNGDQYNTVLSDILGPEFECMPTLYWYGDLNQDGIQDLIFVVTDNERDKFTLLMSDPGHPQLFRQTSNWILTNCDENE